MWLSMYCLRLTFAKTPHPFPNFWSIFVTFFSNPFPTISSADANCEKPLFLVSQAYIKFFLTNPFDMITWSNNMFSIGIFLITSKTPSLLQKKKEWKNILGGGQWGKYIPH